MEIYYNQNPLKTTIELTDEEKREFWLKIKIDEMLWIIADIEFNLDEAYLNVENARKAANLKYILNKENGLDKKIDHWFEIYYGALQDRHMGDCTSVACSCTKCQAEHILGIDTIKGLKCGYGHYIVVAFDETDNINKAIEYLENYNPKIEEGWEQYRERWLTQAKGALEWLTKYREEHFS